MCSPRDPFLRPARLLRSVHTHLEITAAKVLFEGVPARDGARFGAGTTMARAADRITAVGRLRTLTESSRCIISSAWRHSRGKSERIAASPCGFREDQGSHRRSRPPEAAPADYGDLPPSPALGSKPGRGAAELLGSLSHSLQLASRSRHLAHQGSKAYSESFELIHRREADRPNTIWQADHTPLDPVLGSGTGSETGLGGRLRRQKVPNL